MKVKIEKGKSDYITDEFYGDFYTCPHCKDNEVYETFKFCPNCGAEVEWIEIEEKHGRQA